MNKKVTPPQKQGNNNAFKGFFNPNISAQIKEGVRALESTQTLSLFRLSDLVGAGFKFSLVSDKDNTHLTASLFDKRPGSDSLGYVLSIKHADVEIAIALLWFLVYEVYDGKGWLQWIDNVVDLDW